MKRAGDRAMLLKMLSRLVNVPAMLAWRQQWRAAQAIDRSERELELYRKMFGSEFLHVGYFKNANVAAEDVSLRMLSDAMRDYAELVLQRLRPEDQGKTVVDIGCGIGGLMRLLGERGLKPAGVTPNPIHAELIGRQLPGMKVHLTPFQHLDHQALPAPYDLATSTEALHNVPIDQAFTKLKQVVKPGGRLILIDYYRLHEGAKSRSGWFLKDFEAALPRHGITVIDRQDIGLNCLPTMAFGHLWATRVGFPLIEFQLDKYFNGHPALGYLFQPVRDKLKARMDRVEVLDPKVLAGEKAYLVNVLQLPG
jgi:cyclopropane fatty-acyl-phospholipid synthase-like methyltransferase